VRDAALRQRVIDECLVPYLLDRMDAWSWSPGGAYRRDSTQGPGAQQALVDRYSTRGA
jgi:polyphosphate kinase